MVASSSWPRPGDLLVHVESLEYCTKTAIIRNATGAAVSFNNPVGVPLKAGANGADYLIAEAGDEASVIALLVDGLAGVDFVEDIANNTNSPGWQVLCHPPAIININAIKETDPADADYDVAAIVTAMSALGFEFRAEPTKQETL